MIHVNTSVTSVMGTLSGDDVAISTSTLIEMEPKTDLLAQIDTTRSNKAMFYLEPGDNSKTKSFEWLPPTQSLLLTHSYLNPLSAWNFSTLYWYCGSCVMPFPSHVSRTLPSELLSNCPIDQPIYEVPPGQLKPPRLSIRSSRPR